MRWHAAYRYLLSRIKFSSVPCLFTWVFSPAWESIGLVLPAASRRLLRGQTELQGQPAVPKSRNMSSRFHQPHCRREEWGRRGQREQRRRGTELIRSLLPASPPSPIWPAGGMGTVWSFYCTCSSASIVSKTVSCCFQERSQMLVCSSGAAKQI